MRWLALLCLGLVACTTAPRLEDAVVAYDQRAAAEQIDALQRQLDSVDDLIRRGRR
jgi:hypothetical protein